MYLICAEGEKMKVSGLPPETFRMECGIDNNAKTVYMFFVAISLSSLPTLK